MKDDTRGISDESLWNSLPLPLFIADDQGLITQANARAELFLNRPARRMIGRALSDILCPDPALLRGLAHVKTNAAPVYLNDVALLPEKHGHEANIQLSPLAGQVGRYLVLVHPHRIGGHIGRGSDANSAARSAIGMSDMLAHEIKNPLAGITGAAQLLEMSLPKEDHELCGLIVAESRRIVALLDQVAQFGNTRPPARKPMNIHDLLDRAQKSAQLGFARNMRFQVHYDPSLPATFVDGDQMIQVFLNLMKNAAEAAATSGTTGGSTGETGLITLKTSYDHGLRMRGADGQDTRLPLQVEIIDNGPGIPADIQRHMFKPFVSGRENGTGLGLALVSKIISDHASWIRVESRPGRTAFRLSLPIAPKKGAP